uniref:Uncharacterized protein n=1 Tax=Rhizophora mucronata TaxID=61149 RepID=A0A2P2Q7D5_RHIMU
MILVTRTLLDLLLISIYQAVVLSFSSQCQNFTCVFSNIRS